MNEYIALTVAGLHARAAKLSSMADELAATFGEGPPPTPAPRKSRAARPAPAQSSGEGAQPAVAAAASELLPGQEPQSVGEALKREMVGLGTAFTAPEIIERLCKKYPALMEPAEASYRVKGNLAYWLKTGRVKCQGSGKAARYTISDRNWFTY
jgi:hypothetical protein